MSKFDTLCGHYTVWKNEKFEKFTLTDKFFRQINYVVISLVKPLVSRNFCQNYVRVNFCDFHTVRYVRKFTLNFFGKNSVEVTTLVKKSIDS